MADTLYFSPAHLRRSVESILTAGGSEEAEARLVADHLVLANLSGHDSHGIGMIPTYVRNLQKKTLVPNQRVETVLDSGAILAFDGCRGYGQSIGRQAMARAIERCRETGVVLMTLRNCHHLGRIGTYAELAIEAGLASMHFVNVVDHQPYVAPFRGTDSRFMTNPICLSMPGSEGQPPILLDMATSRIAAGKVRVAFNKGEDLPPRSVIDGQGRPTNDSGVFAQKPPGSLLPFGEHKGYGLALFAEIFGGLLSGGKTVQPANERRGAIINNMLTVLIDPGQLVDDDWRRQELEALVAHIKASPPVDPNLPVLVPGDPERASREERAERVPVDQETWDQIRQAAESLGVDPESLE